MTKILKKVLILTPTLSGGGAEKLVSELINGLVNKKDLVVDVVLFENRISYNIKKTPILLNIPIIYSDLMSGIYAIPLGIVKYRRIINKIKPDISFSVSVLDSIVNILSNINSPARKIISVNIATSVKLKNRPKLLRKIFKFIYILVYTKADIIIAASYGVKKDLVDEFKIRPEKVKVIYYPVSIELIRHLSKEDLDDSFLGKNDNIIINIGRLVYQKGQWHLIRIIHEVNRKVPTKLVILGEGPLKKYLEQLTHKLKLNSKVRFTGWTNNPFKYIKNSTIFVFTSLYEALPYSLIEALACGIPIISTDCKYGPKEILNYGKCGILTPPFSGAIYNSKDPLTPEEQYVANRIIELLLNPKLRKKLSYRSIKRANIFDRTVTIDRYYKFLKTLLSN